MRSEALLVALFAASCQGLALMTARPTQIAVSARPMKLTMAARPKQVKRRDVVSGGSDDLYVKIAEAGIREPILFGGLAAAAYFGISNKGGIETDVSALEAGAKAGGSAPAIAISKPVSAVTFQVKVDVTAPKPAEYIWLKDDTSGRVLAVRKGGAKGATALVAQVDKGTSIRCFASYGGGDVAKSDAVKASL